MSAPAATFQTFVSPGSPVGPDWHPSRFARKGFRLRFDPRGSGRPIAVSNAKGADDERVRHAARMYAAVAT
jgi:hypothetical protein